MKRLIHSHEITRGFQAHISYRGVTTTKDKKRHNKRERLLKREVTDPEMLARIHKREIRELDKAERILKEAKKNIEREEGRKFLTKRQKLGNEIKSTLWASARKKGSHEAKEYMAYIRGLRHKKG